MFLTQFSLRSLLKYLYQICHFCAFGLYIILSSRWESRQSINLTLSQLSDDKILRTLGQQEHFQCKWGALLNNSFMLQLGYSGVSTVWTDVRIHSDCLPIMYIGNQDTVFFVNDWVKEYLLFYNSVYSLRLPFLKLRIQLEFLTKNSCRIHLDFFWICFSGFSLITHC